MFRKSHTHVRNGTGYIWAVGDAALHAVFLNSKWVSYQILDERDVKAMKLDAE